MTATQIVIESIAPTNPEPEGLGFVAPPCSPSFDRATYKAECEKRWHGDPLHDALANWKKWQELHDDLLEAMRSYKRNPGMVDMGGKYHNPDATLTSFLWKMQSAWQPNPCRLDPLIDFCDHYQRLFLRRGLLIYCAMLLRCIETTPSTPTRRADSLKRVAINPRLVDERVRRL